MYEENFYHLNEMSDGLVNHASDKLDQKIREKLNSIPTGTAKDYFLRRADNAYYKMKQYASKAYEGVPAAKRLAGSVFSYAKNKGLTGSKSVDKL